MTLFYLSHVIGPDTPSYGGHFPLETEVLKSINEGDSCNEISVRMPLHFGTHVDAPRHFDDSGMTVDQFPPEYWRCTKVCLLDIPIGEDGLVRLSDDSPLLSEIDDDCELLLLRTGSQTLRASSPNLYATRGPSLCDDFASWIRRNRALKFLGIDSISVSSPQKRELGRKAHTALLAPGIGSTVLIIEDMDLSNLQTAPSEVWILPLRLAGADGAPVTVVAKLF